MPGRALAASRGLLRGAGCSARVLRRSRACNPVLPLMFRCPAVSAARLNFFAHDFMLTLSKQNLSGKGSVYGAMFYSCKKPFCLSYYHTMVSRAEQALLFQFYYIVYYTNKT